MGNSTETFRRYNVRASRNGSWADMAQRPR